MKLRLFNFVLILFLSACSFKCVPSEESISSGIFLSGITVPVDTAETKILIPALADEGRPIDTFVIMIEQARCSGTVIILGDTYFSDWTDIFSNRQSTVINPDLVKLGEGEYLSTYGPANELLEGDRITPIHLKSNDFECAEHWFETEQRHDGTSGIVRTNLP